MGGFGHDSVVLDDLLVRAVVEERGDAADGVDAGSGSVLRQTRRSGRRGRSHVHDVDRPAPGLIHHDLRQSLILLVIQQDALSRATGNPEPMHPGLDVELNDLPESVFVQLPLRGHRRNHRRKYAIERNFRCVFLPGYRHSLSPFSLSLPAPVRSSSTLYLSSHCRHIPARLSQCMCSCTRQDYGQLRLSVPSPLGHCTASSHWSQDSFPHRCPTTPTQFGEPLPIGAIGIWETCSAQRLSRTKGPLLLGLQPFSRSTCRGDVVRCPPSLTASGHCLNGQRIARQRSCLFRQPTTVCRCGCPQNPIASMAQSAPP